MKNKIERSLGVLIFAVGVIFGVALLGIVIWGDFEAARFDAAYRFDEPIRTIRCPVIMTEVDIGSVSASFKNPTENSIEFRIRTHISQGSATLMREENSILPLDPGETQRIGWTVTPDDAAFGRLILARVRLFPKYPLPARDGSCGILFVQTATFTGNQIFAFIAGAALLFMAIGAGLWISVNRPLLGIGLAVARSMGALAGCILVGMIIGLLGNWMFGGIILVITVLLVATIIGYFMTRPQAVKS
jgi:hypothetical protein